MSPNPCSSKRQDLQGLRARAVVAVVVFHFFPDAIPIGYLGVDVFFVLYGFLISLVLSKASPTSFTTYTNFYFKRIRRIFPLLLLVVSILILYIDVRYRDEMLFYNTRSALYSLFFLTNQRAQDNGEDYFRKLELSRDLFTHTWSLAVEIQFYLIAPLIIVVPKVCLNKNSMLLLPLLSFVFSISLTYHAISPMSVAFNSMPARLWQFMAGAIAFHLQHNPETPALNEEQMSLINDDGGTDDFPPLELPSIEKSGCSNSIVSYVLSLAILSSTVPFITRYANAIVMARITVTVVSAVLILARREESELLTHPALVSLGNISYALYLVHWPFVCILAELKMEHTWQNLLAISICIFISVLIEKYYEAWYLTLPETSTFLLIFALYSLCFGTIIARDLLHGSGSFSTAKKIELDAPKVDSPLATAFEKQWELEMNRNISIADALAINDRFEKEWVENLQVPNCTMENPKEPNPFGLCTVPPGTGKLKILAVGNSYVADLAGLIAKHFRSHYSTFQQLSVIACEALVESKIDKVCTGGNVQKMREVVQRIKPDVLFVIQRWLTLDTPINNTDNISSDPQYIEIFTNLENISANVQKVFVLQTLPSVKEIRAAIRKRVEEKKPLTDVMPEAMDKDDKWMRMRLNEVAKRCRNCVLFDLKMAHLNKEGGFMVAHPHTHIELFERAMHHTPYGRRLIEPAIARLAQNFEKLLQSKWPENVSE